jgi:hypothetical protein
MVVVSTWARTGWNVISPNVLIDATATRDITAWQQLRGRAIRARRTWTNDCYRLITALVGSQLHGPEAQADMPADVAELLDTGLDAQLPRDVVLNEGLLALLAEVAPRELHARVQAQGLTDLTDAERTRIAIALMRHYNKVTHIFELLKAYGSTIQVQYDRSARVWRRRENIAAKHAHEVAVHPFDGQKLSGDGHAPLVYAQDPRTDVPAELQAHLAAAIAGSDEVIVSGWLDYAGLDREEVRS